MLGQKYEKILTWFGETFMNGCTSITWFGLTTYYTPKARCLDKLSKTVNMDFFLQIPKLLPRRIDTIGGTTCIGVQSNKFKGTMYNERK